jgi:O-antigen ligase/polysaccharide polymerase Wzy-like membrane protein/tetratricopeptide repeat protein
VVRAPGARVTEPRRQPLALFAAGCAFVLPLLFLTFVAVPSWAPRHAVLALEAAVGLPALVLLLVRSDARGPALAAAAFGAWALVAAATSAEQTTAFWGLFAWGTGALFVLALVGSWAVGLSAGGSAPRIETALVAAAVVNAAVAIVQTVADLSSYHLELVDGRATGLLGNPVFLAGFAAGAFWIAVGRFRRRPVAWAAFAALLAVAVEVSGSRYALGLMVVAVLAAFAVVGWRTVTVLALCLGVGVGIGVGLTHYGGGTSVTARSGAEVASGIRPRLETWLSARHAIVERPLLGSGPGRFRAATSRFRTLRVVRAEGADRRFVDAHNLAVEYAVTTGLPGLALLLGWLALAVRRAGWRSPLAGFALIVLAMHLLEPQNVALTPIAFLALGAAAPAMHRHSLPALVPVQGLLAAAALGTAALLLVGSFHLEQARLDLTPDQARQARQLLPAWPEPLRVTAAATVFASKTEGRPELLVTARRWRREAVARDPTDPALWIELARSELDAGLVAAAGRDYRRALHFDPWSAQALTGLGRVARAEGRRSDADRFFRRSLRARPDQPAVRRLLTGGG